MSPRHASRTDIILYLLSAAFAGAVALWADIPQFREWGRIAAIPYLVGALLAVVAWRRDVGVRARWLVAGSVFLTAALLPMSLEVVWRARSDPGLHAQSEVIVTEEAARALARGRDPYVESYLHGPLKARPLPTKTHFPYLPGMLAFGLPRALGGKGWPTDARLWFALASAGLAVAAMARRRIRSGDAIRIFQVLFVLPTGALLMATSGDDLPVLSATLLALVLLSDRPALSGIVAGASLAMKQTAWVLLPFLVLASPDRRRTMWAAGAVAAPVIGAFLIWHPGAFVEDAIKFPLGLGAGSSAAGTVTLGSLLSDVLPGGAATVTAILTVAVLGLGAWLARRQPWPGPASAARSAGIVWVVVFLLAPVARLGYLVYPINLLVWSIALGPESRVDRGETAASIAGSVSS